MNNRDPTQLLLLFYIVYLDLDSGFSVSERNAKPAPCIFSGGLRLLLVYYKNQTTLKRVPGGICRAAPILWFMWSLRYYVLQPDVRSTDEPTEKAHIQ